MLNYSESTCLVDLFQAVLREQLNGKEHSCDPSY